MSLARIDLRSDTVTRPSEGMRRAIAEAEVGDDVFGEDPTIQRLEARVAELLGKEAGLFVPSGTMGNQIAVRVHTEPGDEVILDAKGHSFLFEGGGLAALSGAQARPIPTERGLLDPLAVEAAINPGADHFPRSRLIIVENTSNTGGGTIVPAETVSRLGDLARRHGLALHMDGARLWNAHVAAGESLRRFAEPCDSVSVCLSKGLGAPVGSVLAGSRAFIERAHRVRKMLGGGMRQVGLLGAAGLYALEHNLPRLEEDHRRLQVLAKGLGAMPGLECDPAHFPTNIAYVEIRHPTWTASSLVSALAREGVLVHAFGPRTFRVVTHLELDDEAVSEALSRFGRVVG